MSTSELKDNIRQLLDSTNDEAKLMVVYNALSEGEKDWWDDLSDEQKASVQRGVDDIKSGRVTPHNEAMKELKDFIQSHA